MHRIVIVNTSPLFYLHRLGYLDILEKLYNEVIVPEAVVAELEEGERVGEDVPKVAECNWIRVRKVTIPAFIKMIPDLGQGEAEVLALGCEEVEPLLIIDDALARKIAKLQTFKITGTAGVLLKAKKEGYFKEIKPILGRLKETGFYLSAALIAEILKISGEN
jgi:predicted nucleic acid-binding protein